MSYLINKFKLLQSSRRLKEAQGYIEMAEKKHRDELNDQKEMMEAMRNHYCAEQSELKQLLEDSRLQYLRELDNVIIF